MGMERSYVMIKPEGVKRRLVGEIIKRFERQGLYIAGLKMFTPSQELLKEHYGHLSSRPFFNGLISHMSSGPVVALVIEGKDSVSACRKIIGATNPAEADVGTIRFDFARSVDKNVIHGSDSVENAKKEIQMWFGEVPELKAFSIDELY